MQIWLRGLVVGLLALGILLVKYWSLRRVDELRIASELVVSSDHCLILSSARLVHTALRIGWFLRSSSGYSCWSVILHQLVWFDVVDQSSLLFHLQLLHLDLFLEFHGFLLLGAKVVSTVQYLAVAIWVVYVLVADDRSCVHDVAVWIWILSRKEPALSMALALINNSLLRTWTLTLCKVADVFESMCVLVHLMLAGKSLLELHLLLHLDLLVSQDWMFACATLTSCTTSRLLDLLGLRSQSLSIKGIACVAEHHCIVVLDWWNIHWVGHGPWVASLYELVRLLVVHSGHKHFALILRSVPVEYLWRVLVRGNEWSRAALVVLIRIHVQRLSIGLRRRLVWRDVLILTHNWTYQLGVVDAWVVGVFGCVSRLAGQNIVIIASWRHICAVGDSNAVARVVRLLRLVLSSVVLVNCLLIDVVEDIILAYSGLWNICWVVIAWGPCRIRCFSWNRLFFFFYSLQSLLLKSIQVSADVESWLWPWLLLLMKRYLMVELAQE